MRKRILTAFTVFTGILFISASIVWADPPAPVAKTGQTISYRTGDDGYYEKGVASPSPRFTENGDGTITDNLTGLMWAKDANLTGSMNWSDAIDYANNLSLGSYECGASYIDWRLPNVKELQSLIDFSNTFPALTTGHPFSNVISSFYWTSTTSAYDTGSAVAVLLVFGNVSSDGDKTSNLLRVWPVRGGN